MPKMEITTRIGCRNMCKYCPQKKIISSYKSPEIVMGLKNFKICIDKLPKEVKIVFAGMSEPFLNKDCLKMMEYANKKDFKIELFTTGVGLTEKDVKKLEKIHLDYFELHLPDNANKTSIKIDKEFLNVIKAIKNSKIKDIRYQVFGSLHPEVKKIFEFYVEDLSRLIQNRAGNVEGMSTTKKIRGKLICGSSGLALNNNVLLPNGDVVLCCMDYGLEYKLGNLLDSSYSSLFESSFFKKLQNSLNSNNKEIICRHCSYGRKVNSIKYKMRKTLERLGLIKRLYSLTKYKPIKKIYIYLKKFR